MTSPADAADLDVSIVVVSWNTRDLLRRCLATVSAPAGRHTAEILVVDNGSADGSADMVRGDFPRVRLISNAENRGFAAANNQAIRCARGRYLLLLNSDTFATAAAVDEVAEFMDAHPDAGVAGCKLRYGDGRLQQSWMEFPTLLSELGIAIGMHKLWRRNLVSPDTQTTRAVDAVMGAFMMVRRAAVEETGLLDESYFMYSEEVDWCYRFKQRGWVVYYTPRAEAVHLWGGSSRRVPAETILRLYESRLQFFRKHHGAAAARVVKLLIGLNCVLRLALPWGRRGDSVAAGKRLGLQQLLRSLPRL